MNKYEEKFSQVAENLYDMYDVIATYPITKIKETFVRFCLFFVNHIEAECLAWFTKEFAFYDLLSKDWFIKHHDDDIISKIRANILTYFEMHGNKHKKDDKVYSLHIIHSLFFINTLTLDNFENYFDCFVIKLIKYQQASVRKINEGICQALA